MSRQMSSLPWDLLEAALLSILALALTLLPRGISEFSIPLGIILVIIPPGYAIILALFPRASDLAIKQRMILSAGASAIVAALVALILSFVGRINPSTFAQTLAIISLALIVIAYLRWATLPKGWRFIPSIRSNTLPAGRRQSNNDQRIAYVVLASMAAIIIVSAFVYAGHNNTAVLMTTSTPAENGEKKSTEFYILDKSSQANIKAGSKSTIMAGIINREHRTVDYTLRLVINGSVLSEKNVKLNHNNSWEGPLSYTIGSPVNKQRVDLLLYEDNNYFEKPYSEKTFWINVSNQVVAQKEIKEESKPVAKPNDQSKNDISAQQRNEGSGGEAADIQNSQASSIEENKPATEEVVTLDTSSNTTSSQLSEQTEQEQKVSPENMTKEPNVENNVSANVENNTSANVKNNSLLVTENNPLPIVNNDLSRQSKTNISSGNITLNFSGGVKVMNASDIDQDSYEANGKIGTLGEKENNSGRSVSQIQSSTRSIDNFSINNSQTNPYSTPQKFYTRPKPGTGSTTSKVATVSENTSVSKSGSNGDQHISSGKISDVSNNVLSNNATKVDTSVNNVNKSGNIPSNLLKNVSIKPQESKPTTLQDEEAARMAEMAKKIDSWVSTRGMKPANSSSSFKSDFIQFNSKNNSVVLGSQSSKAKKIG